MSRADKRSKDGIPAPIDVTHTLGDVEALLPKIRNEYKTLHEQAHSGITYREFTDTVVTGGTHTDPTGEAAMFHKDEETDEPNARGRQRDDLRYVARKVEAALRALENAYTVLGRGIRKGDYRHPIRAEPVDSRNYRTQVSPSEKHYLKQAQRRREERGETA